MDRFQLECHNIETARARLDEPGILRWKCFHVAHSNTDAYSVSNTNALTYTNAPTYPNAECYPDAITYTDARGESAYHGRKSGDVALPNTGILKCSRPLRR